MQKIVITGLLWMFSSLVYSFCTVKDDKGHSITLKNPAKRIISLAPDLTEDLFAIGAGDKIVGVIQGSDYPSDAKNILKVASYHHLDIEALISTHPDLIVTWSQGVNISTLAKWGIPIYVSDPKKLTDIPRTLQNLGCLVDEFQKAKQIAKNYMQRYHKLAEKFSRQPPIRVFYQIWTTPVITIAKGSWINEAITFCGGKNVFESLKGAAPEITIEAVIIENPDIIISSIKKEEWKNTWLAWSDLQAVKEKRLLTVHSDLIERPGPRLMDGVTELCIAMNDSRKNRGKNVADEL